MLVDPKYRLSPMAVYALLHDVKKCVEFMLGMKPSQFAPQQWERMEKAWDAPFMLDDSGRSTGKSHNLLAIDTIKLPLIPDRSFLLLGMDKEIGNELFDEHISRWIQPDSQGNLKYYLDTRRIDMEGRVKQTGYGREVLFRVASQIPGVQTVMSRFITMTPDLKSDGKKMQSWRFNGVHFNEWTSWPDHDIMAETIEPIATRTNYWYKKTVDLRVMSETHMQEPLGALDDYWLAEAFMLNPGEDPRPHINNDTDPEPDHEIIRRFKRNFKITYGFDYDDGVLDKHTHLPPVTDPGDLHDFFAKFMNGDPVLYNQLTYDGSAKRPSDDCYNFRQFFEKKEVEEQNPLYKSHNMSIDDLGPEWDGVIYSSSVIRKYRDSHLDEDYQRVYGGKWVEGYKHKPYDPEEIRRCMDPKLVPGLRAYPGENAIIAVDAAKGTEKMRAGVVDRTQGMGQGDDAGAAIITLGDNTPANPHEIKYVYVANDVRKDPMAADLHDIAEITHPIAMILDPGGGGGDLMDSLGKDRLIMPDGTIKTVRPIVLADVQYEVVGENPIGWFMSQSNEIIKAVYKYSPDATAAFRTDDALVNKVHEISRLAFNRGLVKLPRLIPQVEIIQKLDSGEITIDEAEAIETMNRAIEQIKMIAYKLDKDGNREKTKQGLFRYTSPKRKDLAYCILYSIFFAYTWVEYHRQVDKANGEGIAIAIG